MASRGSNILSEILQQHESQIVSEWLHAQLAATSLRGDLMTESQLREQSRQLLAALRSAAPTADPNDIHSAQWQAVRDVLTQVSRKRAQHSFSPSETATFVFSLKQPLFSQLSKALAKDAPALATELWNITVLLDKLGLYTTEVYQKSREEMIARQQRELLELSTPVVQLWQGVLALPLIGTLDSERTQVVM